MHDPEPARSSNDLCDILDDAPGERRIGRIEGGRIVEIVLDRASWAGRRARHGDRFSARVSTVDPRRRGAFLDLGLAEETGFLPLDGDARARTPDGDKAPVREGERLEVRVMREAARGKGPVLALAPGSPEPRAAPPPRAPYNPIARTLIDGGLEQALARAVSIPGGGRLVIEPTAALVAIDVDAEGRDGPADGEAFVRALNLAACREAFHQLRLRALGGLVAIDFVSMRTPAHRVALEAEAKASARALTAGSGVTIEIAPLSRFGVLELALAQTRTPLHEVLLAPDGRPTAETLALEALRALEREGRANPGARLALTLPPAAAAWLEAAALDIRAEMTRRLGPRFAWTPDPALRDRCDVRVC